jgi:hypothetical protein
MENQEHFGCPFTNSLDSHQLTNHLLVVHPLPLAGGEGSRLKTTDVRVACAEHVSPSGSRFSAARVRTAATLPQLPAIATER